MGVGKRKGTVVLGKREETILQTVYFYRYMTALDVCWLLYSPSSVDYVRKILTTLSGGADFVEHEYLYRLRLPEVLRGNPERIYTLGSRGRDFLVNVLGVTVNWYFRPDRVKHMGFRVLMHNLLLTRFLVAANRFGKESSRFRLAKTRICYELAEDAGAVEIEGLEKREQVSVVPDGWLLFESVREGRHEHYFPVLVEIDRGTMFQERFKRHVRSRIAFVECGAYERIFGTGAVVIAYATSSAEGAFTEGRRQAMCDWTMEVLAESGREAWARVFRFGSMSYRELYESSLFDKPVWYQPGEKRAVSLFGA